MARSDAPLIRYLSETHGEQTARDWQKPPLVLLPGDDFVQYLREHESTLMELMPDIWQLPWNDVVFDYQEGRRLLLPPVVGLRLERGSCWIRSRTFERYQRNSPVSSPWLEGEHDLLRGFDGEWLPIEVWEGSVLRPDGTIGFPHYPDVSLVRRSDPQNYQDVAHLYPNLDCRSGRAFGDGHGFCNIAQCQFRPGHPIPMACAGSDLVMSAGVRLLLLTLAYLLQAPEHLVEVTPRPDRKAGKADRKPWTRSLPHLILLDPARSHEYGAPGGSGNGTHASPRPHGRRGHWRTLRAERFQRDAQGNPRRVFVRESWIGATEWESEGNRYRVLTPT